MALHTLPSNSAPSPKTAELREYVTTHYLLLYARIQGTIYLLSIRHQRQLSFDFESHWDV